jgi:hypothetical protein
VVKAAFDLHQSAKAKDGKYHVATRWALEFGLGTPHKEVIESPRLENGAPMSRPLSLMLPWRQRAMKEKNVVREPHQRGQGALQHPAGLRPTGSVSRPAAPGRF